MAVSHRLEINVHSVQRVASLARVKRPATESWGRTGGDGASGLRRNASSFDSRSPRRLALVQDDNNKVRVDCETVIWRKQRRVPQHAPSDSILK